MTGPRLHTRRALVQGLAVAPVAAATLSACGSRNGTAEDHVAANATAATAAPGAAYTPTFFNADEWAFLHAACDRLIPADEHGPGAVELGVLEFLDRHMQTPYASGAIWYMQGPFVEASPSFGYQGPRSLRELLRVGVHAMNAHCAHEFNGKAFANLEPAQQEQLLKAAEAGTLELDDISSQLFFAQLLAETRNGYFADPMHGGNKNMGSWKMIGYPGMRADYTDWVEVRDKPYPFPPVDLAGRRYIVPSAGGKG